MISRLGKTRAPSSPCHFGPVGIAGLGWPWSPKRASAATIRSVAGLTDEERQRLTKVVSGRVGRRSDAKELVSAYLCATERSAFLRTTADGPVPTSLPVERSLVLIEVSRQLQRVIEDFEIQALFRVSASQARTMRTALLATYPDLTNELSLSWSLVDSYTNGRQKGRGFTGTVVVFADADRRDGFAAYCKRLGIGVEDLLGNEELPWRLLVSDDFPKDSLPK